MTTSLASLRAGCRIVIAPGHTWLPAGEHAVHEDKAGDLYVLVAEAPNLIYPTTTLGRLRYHLDACARHEDGTLIGVAAIEEDTIDAV